MLDRNNFSPIFHRELQESASETESAEAVGSRFPDSPGWTYPQPDISNSDGHCEIRLYVPGLEIESVVVEASEELMVLSGLRWVKPSDEPADRLAPFRLLIDLPNAAAGERWTVSYQDDNLILQLAKLYQATTGT